jgi:hypothetical protein
MAEILIQGGNAEAAAKAMCAAVCEIFKTDPLPSTRAGSPSDTRGLAELAVIAPRLTSRPVSLTLLRGRRPPRVARGQNPVAQPIGGRLPLNLPSMFADTAAKSSEPHPVWYPFLPEWFLGPGLSSVTRRLPPYGAIRRPPFRGGFGMCFVSSIFFWFCSKILRSRLGLSRKIRSRSGFGI